MVTTTSEHTLVQKQVRCPDGKPTCEVFHVGDACYQCNEPWPCKAAAISQNERLKTLLKRSLHHFEWYENHGYSSQRALASDILDELGR